MNHSSSCFRRFFVIVTRKNIENRDVSWNHYLESLCCVHSLNTNLPVGMIRNTGGWGESMAPRDGTCTGSFTGSEFVPMTTIFWLNFTGIVNLTRRIVIHSFLLIQNTREYRLFFVFLCFHVRVLLVEKNAPKINLAGRGPREWI